MTRTLIPSRRYSEVFAFEHGGFQFTGSASWLQTGELVELFIEGGKNGTAIQAAARDMAVAASLALQHGTPLDVLRQAVTRDDTGAPAGPLGAFLDVLGGV